MNDSVRIELPDLAACEREPIHTPGSIQPHGLLVPLDAAAHKVRHMLGFDRVLIYRFDSVWNGQVVAESRNDALPSYLDLRFPASDIPRQARDLYHVSRLRLIADVNYTFARLVPSAGPGSAEPVDLSFAALRSVSPVHLEYLRTARPWSSRTSARCSVTRRPPSR